MKHNVVCSTQTLRRLVNTTKQTVFPYLAAVPGLILELSPSADEAAYYEDADSLLGQ